MFTIARSLRLLVLALLVLATGCSSGESDENLDSLEQATTQTCGSSPLPGECKYFPLDAFASSVENGSTHTALKAIDGDCSTRWSSQFSDPQWLKVDLGARKPLSRVVIRWEAAASSDYKLQVSDNAVDWTTIATKANATITGTGSNRVDTIANLSASARYVRVYSLARTTQYGNSIFEFEVFGTGCGPSAGCSQIPVFILSASASSAENSQKGADKAIDGLSSTRWSSAFSDPQWLRLDLGSSQTFTRVVLDWEAASSAKYEIQVSQSSSGPWTVVHTHQDSRVGPRTDDIVGLNATARYVRINSLRRTTSYGNSLFEVRLFRESCEECEQILVPTAAEASSKENNEKAAGKAIDGDISTRWSSQFSDPQWLRLDFGQERRIDQLILKWESAASRSYKIEVSSSAAGPWQVLTERTNQPAGPRIDYIADLGASAQFLRIFSTARTTSFGNSLYEVVTLGAESPFACGGCLLGDIDIDGVNDCQDACDRDPTKAAPGACGCGESEFDGDSDGVPRCHDACDGDPNNTEPGQCGCSDNPAPAGTPCTDGPCGAGVCNGAGVCGDPASCRPDPTCSYRRIKKSWYWFCTGPVSWSTAATRCQTQVDRRLVSLSTRIENDLVSGVAASLPGSAWLGANDLGVEGTWRWATTTGNDGLEFWLGGPSGDRVKPSRFENWVSGQPQDANDCGRLNDNTNEWSAASCSDSIGYICEKPVALTPRPTRDPDFCKLFEGRFCQPEQLDSPDCVPASDVLPATTAEAYAQIEQCEQAYENGDCTEADVQCPACTGAASVPPPESLCPPFEDEEKGFCSLQNTLETGCTDSEHCCSIFESSPVARQGFDSGTGGFSYVDDAFRTTAQPGYASGQRVTTGGLTGAALQVTVGGVDSTTVLNMSGGWQTTFTLDQEAHLLVTFDYNLTQAAGYEPGEFSEVLLSVDGVLFDAPLSLTDYVDQVMGDGNAGPAITTGWRPMTRNLGVFSAGTHTLRIGAFNNQKTIADESTTLLIDNVGVQTKASDCPSGYVCGPVYKTCTPCDSGEQEGGSCDPGCTDPGVRRCGLPFNANDVTPPEPQKSCANDEIFPERCEQIEICSDPLPDDISDPTTNPQSDLEPEEFVPEDVFNDPEAPETLYPADPPCPSAPCAGGPPLPNVPLHQWCVYDVDGSPVPHQPVPPDTKQGAAGGEPLSFTFDPSISMDFTVDPLPFGVPTFNLNASASFLASVGFNIPPVPAANVDIIDALLAAKADRCSASLADSHLKVFGLSLPLDDFLPEPLEAPGGVAACEAAIDDYVNAVNRVKKAYRDAIELIEQYKDRRDGGTSFPTDLCQTLVQDAPPGFPVHSCGSETAAATINRFIDYYEQQIRDVLNPALIGLSNGVLENDGAPVLFFGPAPRETQTILNVTFPIGPIPMKLELEAFVGYGMDGEVRFEFYDGTSSVEDTGEAERVAFVEAHAIPYALAGMSLFVGAGFGVNGFDVSAGVQGDVTFGSLSMDNFAGAGIAVQPVPDMRDFPADVVNAGEPSSVASKVTLFPASGARDYQFSFDYSYGSGIDVTDVLKGSIAARLKLKIAFFSKTWRKVLLRFPGFDIGHFDLLTGGGSFGSIGADDLPLWGTVQMPLPFTQLERLPESEVLPGTASPIDLTRVGELFFDGLCECSQNGEACDRNAECCNRPGAVCFSDPLSPTDPYCAGCRNAGQTCNNDDECCNPDAICRDENDSLPPGVKVCSCLGIGSTCTTIGNCCQENNGGTALFCEDESEDTLPNTSVCRECRHQDEPCSDVNDCCPESDITECECDVGSNCTQKVCKNRRLK